LSAFIAVLRIGGSFLRMPGALHYISWAAPFQPLFAALSLNSSS
jgi:hypothetical protein